MEIITYILITAVFLIQCWRFYSLKLDVQSIQGYIDDLRRQQLQDLIEKKRPYIETYKNTMKYADYSTTGGVLRFYEQFGVDIVKEEFPIGELERKMSDLQKLKAKLCGESYDYRTYYDANYIPHPPTESYIYKHTITQDMPPKVVKKGKKK